MLITPSYIVSHHTHGRSHGALLCLPVYLSIYLYLSLSLFLSPALFLALSRSRALSLARSLSFSLLLSLALYLSFSLSRARSLCVQTKHVLQVGMLCLQLCLQLSRSPYMLNMPATMPVTLSLSVGGGSTFMRAYIHVFQ
jgi:hypothetical protein